jgi:hypothetical protein
LAGSYSTLILAVGSAFYSVTCYFGALVTTPSFGPADSNPVLSDGSSVWEVSVNSSGILVTTTSSASADTLSLLDSSGSGVVWEITCGSSGQLVSSPVEFNKGLCVAALVVGEGYVDFTGYGGGNPEYGVVIDMYVAGGSSDLDYTGRVNESRGVCLYSYTSDESGMVWYRSVLRDLGSQWSEMLISDAFIPVLLHGVVGLAFNRIGDGQDVTKAELMNKVFVAECEAIKRSFQYRWA